ncbi:MAG TPA: phosphate ABC transporter permease subunit PstC [Verrucomicrobiota bacterium]|nr:phosphate ABC transporter permease subunit PstC [Verrucomicrobiota bacterium]HPU55182.1 phosphate ABC transporter permease subunit PstC [Verrucomicrobiota bacterium]
MGLKRGHRARPAEWLTEKLIFAVSLSAILTIVLIFLFIGKEALPVALGRVNSARAQEVIPVAQMETMSPAELQRYLELTPEQYEQMDGETLRTLMELKVEIAGSVSDNKDARVNTASWRHLLLPHQWEGYSEPEYIWQPVSEIHKFNIVPLIVGSLKITLVALVFAVPLSLLAAIYVSQLARPRLREVVKPVIELLAGIPSVVLGFFGLVVLATVVQRLFGTESRLNAFVAGIALGFSVIPVVFSIAEDALTSVPRNYVQAALALGASQWRAAWQVVVPAAVPGLFAAVALGFGRAIGETMIVLMASGNASILSWDLFDSARTITATIAAELGEVVIGSPHYRILFLIGVLLFAVTFITNLAADVVMHRLKERMEGRR